jgi:hypothetical protein
MKQTKKETKLQELERRIADLEKNKTIVIQQPLPPYPFSFAGATFCQICNSWYYGQHQCYPHYRQPITTC